MRFAYGRIFLESGWGAGSQRHSGVRRLLQPARVKLEDRSH